MNVKQIIIFVFAFVILALTARYILQEAKISESRIVMTGPGYGLEINGGRALTALHVAVKTDYPIVYGNAEKDIAVINTGHSNKYNLEFIASVEDFFFTDEAPLPGESGAPYIRDGKIYGVIVGESGGQGVAAALDESVIGVLNAAKKGD